MKIVIIGGVAAGAKAAAKSRRLLPDAEIDIYTQENNVSFNNELKRITRIKLK